MEIQDIDACIYKWHENHPRYWHNMSRWVGMQHLREDIEFVLFLDADEIIDSRFNEWLTKEKLLYEFDAFLFLCYWYFREAKYRAKTWEKAGVLVKKNKLTADNIFTAGERLGIVSSLLPNAVLVNGLDGTPMVHHYSWVRPKEEMLRKVRSWAHKDDADWQRLIEEEFSHDFRGTDFLPHHNYQYETITPVHDIKL